LAKNTLVGSTGGRTRLLVLIDRGGVVMARRKRREYSALERRELWDRWRRGESISDIGRALDRAPGTIHCTIRQHGGVAPRERRRSRIALSLCEREEISRGVAAGHSARRIAAGLDRSPSTISRELGRHGGRRRYRAADADRQAWDQSRRPKPCRLATNVRLRGVVAKKLAQEWSPEQISGWLVVTYPGDETMRVSPETIYRTLFIQARGALKKELVSHLRRVRSIRRSKHASTEGQPRGQIRDAVSIAERPAEVADRAVPGHWEGDLLSGSKNTHIATLVERQSRYVMLVRLDGKDTTTVVDALTRQVQTLPDQLRHSLTWDRGMELADHHRFSVATDVAVYFCDPKSPWQRGSNENTNGLLRQYLPRRTDLSQHSQHDLDQIALRLNTRPRKTLGYQTPAAILDRALR
jgi:IS30 family transposase